MLVLNFRRYSTLLFKNRLLKIILCLQNSNALRRKATSFFRKRLGKPLYVPDLHRRSPIDGALPTLPLYVPDLRRRSPIDGALPTLPLYVPDLPRRSPVDGALPTLPLALPSPSPPLSPRAATAWLCACARRPGLFCVVFVAEALLPYACVLGWAGREQRERRPVPLAAGILCPP